MDLQIINETDGTHSIFMYLPKYIKNPMSFIPELSKIDFLSGEYTDHTLDRVQKFYSLGTPFCKYWKKTPRRWESNIYPDWLIELQLEVQQDINEICKGIIDTHPNFTRANFTSALINKYRNGSDYIPEHRDTAVLERDPTIVSLSFGETRTFRINRLLYNPDSDPRDLIYDPDQQFSKEWTLKSGDLFIMAGSAQKYFSHTILKDATTDPRWNITFR